MISLQRRPEQEPERTIMILKSMKCTYSLSEENQMFLNTFSLSRKHLSLKVT